MAMRTAVWSGFRRAWCGVVAAFRWVARQAGGPSGATKINYGT